MAWSMRCVILAGAVAIAACTGREADVPAPEEAAVGVAFLRLESDGCRRGGLNPCLYAGRIDGVNLSRFSGAMPLSEGRHEIELFRGGAPIDRRLSAEFLESRHYRIRAVERDGKLWIWLNEDGHLLGFRRIAGEAP